MTDDTTETKTSAAERREADAEAKALSDRKRADAVRDFQAAVLALVVQTAQQRTLDFSEIAEALERSTAAAKAMAGKK